MLLVSVPGYSIHKYDRNHYSVAVTNGNMGAGILDKEQFKQFVKENNGKDYREPAKKVAIGLAVAGAITAGIIFRKPIAKMAKQAFEMVKNSKAFQKAAEFAKIAKDKVVFYGKKYAGKFTDMTKKAYESFMNYATKASEKIKNVDFGKLTESVKHAPKA